LFHTKSKRLGKQTRGKRSHDVLFEHREFDPAVNKLSQKTYSDEHNQQAFLDRKSPVTGIPERARPNN
jgi:hypothetical protein